MSKETLPFTVSPSIIRHLIERQAGTLDKAILELITNGIDAGATRVDVVFNDDRFVTVSDNGRGFRSREEIEKHFADFGFDHETDAERALGRINGCFGMGRSQIYGFGRSVWRTHEFRMDVDIRSDRDLAFDLALVDEPPVDGCHIRVELYKPLSNVDKEVIRRTLKDHVKYAPSAIYVDGDRVNKDLDDIKWSAQSDRLLFLNKATATYGLEVHNLGIFVNRFSRSQMGVSGVVVSKVPHSFKVTMSRTDVHRSCDLWKEMLDLIKPFKERQRRKRQLSDADRMGIARDWLWGELTDTTVMKQSRVFRTVKGNYITLKQLENHSGGLIAIEKDRGDRVAEAIHESHTMAVLCRDFYDWIDADSDTSVVWALNTMKRLAYGTGAAESFALGEYSVAKSQYDGNLITVDPKQYTKTQKAQLRALTSINHKIAKGVQYGQRRITTGGSRRLTLGDADTAQAWTDGRNYICISRKFMGSCFNSGMEGVLRLMAVMVHEQLHTEPDRDDGHDHPPEFFEAFENVITSNSMGLFSAAAQAMRRYDEERQKLGLERSLTIAKAIDQIEKTDDQTGEETAGGNSDDVVSDRRLLVSA